MILVTSATGKNGDATARSWSLSIAEPVTFI
jgi:hypothetical protein